MVLQLGLQHEPGTTAQILDSTLHLALSTSRTSLNRRKPIQQYLQSSQSTDHLKQFWDAITPTLYHHFLCRNAQCKHVILNSHGLRTMDHNSPKQGVYLCPHCLEIYRPFAATSRNSNIGTLVQAKQCLVVKTPTPHPANSPLVGGQQLASDDQEHNYHCFLMEWLEKDTQPFLDQLRIITAELLKGYDQALDKVAYLHQQIHLRIRKTQRLPYMTWETWTPENIETITARNTQAGTNKYKNWNYYPRNGTADWGRKNSFTTASSTPATTGQPSYIRLTLPIYWHSSTLRPSWAR